jgi:hypothetical protein
MIISVTEEDIAGGQRRNSFRCPVANALRRSCGAHYAYVGRQIALVIAGDPPAQVIRTVRLPPDACIAISDYDHDMEMRPFSFGA